MSERAPDSGSRLSAPRVPGVRSPWRITTARLVLRPFTDGDLDALHAIHSREEVTRYLYWGARTPEETRAALSAKVKRTALSEELGDGDSLAIAAERRDSGMLIGDCSLWIQSAIHRQGEIGYVFHPDHHGHGFATEASRELLRLAFDRLRLHRVAGRLDARNRSSARVLERLGMRLEARLRENEWVKREWTDELIYGLLEREWRAQEAGRANPVEEHLA
jgi:RimJ/RimL family protein N-acetyltransferase